ncbi:protein RRP5 homolog [Dendroctonus ponderosae]|uniref:protein RRP5 homolog n=1 Tax=Dendroctonus ponderosae TaxID=77166 RepID=UPI002035C6C5|nr:protein RRP5 homolog [Dendroctonus ponderosae]KAH1024610.1 hypothetical protein HUJ05_004070 [Dendroctonus ponderosae]
MVEEENFPRGGKLAAKRPPPENANLFSLGNSSKPKKSKTSKKKPTPSDDVFEAALHVRGSLTYNQIQTGMVILGCIRNIYNFALEVELPGLCFATVPITEISDPFTKHLNQQLENNDPNPVDPSELFSVGDFLPIKIMAVETRDSGTHVEASINPREIYADQNHSSFAKGMLVWACVQSQSDHGYEMTLGVKHCRAFVPFKNIDDEPNYEIGKPLWCVTHKVDSTATASILRLSAKLEHVSALTGDIQNLDSALPGTKVNFVVEKILAQGLQGKFGDHFIGYINENHLTTPLKRPTDYKEAKVLSAYILFVEPTTKITHLSLRVPERAEKPTLKIGDIVTAQVIGKSANGFIFMLPQNLKGFATHKRLLNSIVNNHSADISDKINAKFSPGSKHKCRILDFNYLSQMFICTPESAVLKESTFTPSNLKPGQVVQVKIASIKEEGLVVTTGHVRGFVPNLHISNSEFTRNVKSKFKEKQTVNARVLSVEDGKVLFTIKPMLVQNDECLAQEKDAEVGKQFMGVVSKISEAGVLIVFYANIKGWMGKPGMGRSAADPSKYFFLGQVVNVYIGKKVGDCIFLCLFPPKDKEKEKPFIPSFGGRYSGIVKVVKDDGLDIQLNNTTKRGFIPNAHLSENLSLCQAIKNTFSVGDQVSDVMYIGGTKPQLFSRREANVSRGKEVLKLEALKEGQLVRCAYQSTASKGLFVQLMVQGISKPVLIRKVNIDENIPELVPHQLVIAQVQKVDMQKQKIDLSIKLKDVYKNNVEGPLDLFTQYLQEEVFLHKMSCKLKWEICKYNLGQQEQCKVEKIAPQGGCVVSLSDGKVKGVVVPSLCPKALKEGDSVVGVIIGHDYEKRFLHVCIRPDIISRISEVQNGSLKAPISSCYAEKLLVKDECIVSILRHPNGNKQLVYLPVKLHENDFVGCMSYYKAKKFKICVCGKLKKFLIGISTKLFITLDRTTNKRKSNGKLEKLEETEPEEMLVESEGGEMEDQLDEVECENMEVEVESSDEATDEALDDEEKIEPEPVILPGVSSFFTIGKTKAPVEESSDDEDEGPTERKKMKLSPAERADLLRTEEERIAKIEKELADTSKAPESAEQFDRLLLSKPDSAELWAKYIAFHIAATEIDKARSVAKRALATINMTKTEEKFKIWIVFLKLENMFGTEETFEKALEDALKFNDSLQVYLKVIEMFAENGKFTEMEGKISKVRAKYKQEPTMWLELGRIYYQIGQFKEGRNCKDRALKSITDKKSQMTIIIRFAIMEFKYGESDQGCAIFETILLTSPRKINIWMTYVDQLVKKGDTEQARLVLERAMSQKLPPKSIKSLQGVFRKFGWDTNKH